jgi:AAA+ superfamily predicted ATPase
MDLEPPAVRLQPSLDPLARRCRRWRYNKWPSQERKLLNVYLMIERVRKPYRQPSHNGIVQVVHVGEEREARLVRRQFRTWLSPSPEMPTKAPVIVITGTPGTGKTTLSQRIVQESPVALEHINVGDWIKEKNLHEGFDSEWQSYIVDEDKVCPFVFCLSTYLYESSF